MLFSPCNYKVEAAIPHGSVAEASAYGPRYGRRPQPHLCRSPDTGNAGVVRHEEAHGESRFGVKSPLTVNIASYVVRSPFAVILGADLLLWSTYIEKHVKQVRSLMKFIQLANRVRVPIRRHAQAIPLGRPTKETHCVTPAPSLTQSAEIRVRRRTRSRPAQRWPYKFRSGSWARMSYPSP